MMRWCLPPIAKGVYSDYLLVLQQGIYNEVYENKSMEKISAEGDKLASISKLSKSQRTLYFSIGSTLVFFLYTILFLNPVSSCFRLEDSSNSLGLTFSYTSEMVQNFFELRSQDQLHCYSQFLQIWDVIFAVIYTLMYCFWILYFLDNRRIFLIVPLLAMIADWSENYAELLMINSHLNSNLISETLVSVGSGINSFKWILLTLTYLIILIGIMITLKSVITKPKQFHE
jgi:hypothetical protein